MSTYKKLIEEHQAPSLKRVLDEALHYHFKNFVRLEDLGEPYSFKDQMNIVEAATRMQANTDIKFEIQAYLLQYRRLRHFIHYLQRNGDFNPPTDPELKQTWDDLMKEEGMINLLANKWAAHRSVDDPRGESDSFHLAVLLNLESTVSYWGNGHIYLFIGNHEFYLFDYHPKVIKFIDWVFSHVKK